MHTNHHRRATTILSRGIFIATLVLNIVTPLSALDPAVAIHSYAVRAWHTAQGFSEANINAIATTRDGYVWCGTEAGLIRFDGLRFMTFDKKNTAAVLQESIVSLLSTEGGLLWIGTTGGLVKWDGRAFVGIPLEGVQTAAVRTLTAGSGGSVWIGTDGGGTYHATATSSSATRARGTPANDYVDALLEDRGVLWIGTALGLRRVDASGASRTYTTENGLPSDRIVSLLRSDAGAIWVMTAKGLARITGDEIT